MLVGAFLANFIYSPLPTCEPWDPRRFMGADALPGPGLLQQANLHQHEEVEASKHATSTLDSSS